MGNISKNKKSTLPIKISSLVTNTTKNTDKKQPIKFSYLRTLLQQPTKSVNISQFIKNINTINT